MPPVTAVGVSVRDSNTITLSVLNFSISLDPDCNKKKLGLEGFKPSATEAVIDPVNILSAKPPPPPPEPGREDVTYSVPLLVSIKTVFKLAPPGGIAVGSRGAIIVLVLSNILVVPDKSTLSDLTSKLPVDLKEPDIVWSPLKILEPVIANTDEAVLFNSREFEENEDEFDWFEYEAVPSSEPVI